MLIKVLLLISIPSASPQGVFPQFLSVLNPPQCLLHCSKPLAQQFESFLRNKVVVKSFDNLCSVWDATRQCMQEETNCTESMDLFDDFTSGLQYACVDEVKSFRTSLQCIQVYLVDSNKHIDCDSACRVQDFFKDLVTSPDVVDVVLKEGGYLQIIEHLGPICNSMSCFIKCTRSALNNVCAASGTKIAEMMLRPLDRLSENLRNAPDSMQRRIRTLIPETCRQFVLPKYLDELRYDEDFLTQLRILITTTKKQHMNRHSDDTAKTIRQLITEFDGPVADILTTYEPAQWDISTIFYLCFIVFIFILIFIGLVLSVMLCLRKESVTNSDSSFKTFHFGKPSLRFSRANNDDHVHISKTE